MVKTKIPGDDCWINLYSKEANLACISEVN